MNDPHTRAPDELRKIEQHILERVRLGAELSLTEEFAVDVDVWEDIAARTLRVSLAAWIVGGARHKTALKWHHVPSTWWDHLKEGWFPAWLLEWFPAAHDAVPVEIFTQHVCPHIPFPHGCGREAHFDFLTMIPPGEGDDG